MEFELTVPTSKSPKEAVAAVEAALAERKFGVLWHLDVNQKLAEKGFDLVPEVHILEVCNPAKAKHAIETNLKVTAFLPCKVIVRSQNGETEIAVTRPSMLLSVLGDERLKGMAEEVESVLLAAVEAAK